MQEKIGNKGFAGWDIALEVGILRGGYECKLIEEEEAKDVLEEYIRKAEKKFKNWEEYATSYLCGGIYCAYKKSDFEIKVTEELGRHFLNIAIVLLIEEKRGYWKNYKWLGEE